MVSLARPIGLRCAKLHTKGMKLTAGRSWHGTFGRAAKSHQNHSTGSRMNSDPASRAPVWLWTLKTLSRPERLRHARHDRIVGLFGRRRIGHHKVLVHAVRQQMLFIEYVIGVGS